jgi:hypothetical protein
VNRTIVAACLLAGCSPFVTPSPAPSFLSGPCPVTLPDQVSPEATASQLPSGDYFVYGSGALRVALPRDGEITTDVSAGQALPLLWQASRQLSVSARRLDGAAPAVGAASKPEGPPSYQLTNVVFPRIGCWQLTGTIDGTRLTLDLVVRVTNAVASGDRCPSVPSVLEPDPLFAGTLSAQAGPLEFRGGAASAQADAVIDLFFRGAPMKVLIVPLRGLTSEVWLRGWRCSDHRALYFHYGGGGPGAHNTTEELERLGTATPRFGPMTSGVVGDGVFGFAGYILFTSPGLWKSA